MINRQQGIVIGVGAVLGVACLVLGALFFMALSTSSGAAEQRDQAYGQLKALYQAKVFPSDANIKRMKEDQVVLEAWAIEASNMLTKASIKADDLSPFQFKQELQKTVRELAAEKSPAGKFVTADFKFGFDRYMDSDSLPQKSDVAQLAQQLKLIHLVVRELYASNIGKLTAIERDVFEADAADKKSGSSSVAPRRAAAAAARRPGQTPSTGTAPAETDALSPVLSSMLTRQKFTFGFQAKPSALIAVLNRLAAMDAFLVVSGVEFVKTEDSILIAEQRKKEAAKVAEEAKTSAASAAVPPGDRTVTDPGREPPLNVKLSVDVYLFKGV